MRSEVLLSPGFVAEKRHENLIISAESALALGQLYEI